MVIIEVTIIQEGYTEDKTTIETEMSTYNKGSVVNADYLSKDLELHQYLPVEIMTDVQVVDSLLTLPRLS